MRKVSYPVRFTENLTLTVVDPQDTVPGMSDRPWGMNMVIVAGQRRRLAGVIVVAVCAVALVTEPGSARAGGFYNIDVGARRTGMFAVMGKPDDVSAIVHNPAGLVLQQGTTFQVSTQYTNSENGFRFYDLEGKLQPSEEISADSAWGLVPFLGVASDLGTKRFRLGFAAWTPKLFETDLPDGGISSYYMTDTFQVASRFTLSGAVELGRHVAIGAGISAVYLHSKTSQVGNLDMLSGEWENRFDTEESEIIARTARDFLMTQTGSAWTWDWNVGILLRPTDSIGLGFSFTSGAVADLEGELEVESTGDDAKRILGDGTISVGQTTRVALPYTLRAGLNWELFKGLELGFDFTYWHNQVYRERYTTLDEDDLEGTSLGNFLTSPIRVPKAYNNSFNISTGLMYRPLPELDLMVGYQYDRTAVPDRTLALDEMGLSFNALGLGLRWRPLQWFGVGFTFQRTWYEVMEVQTSILEPAMNAKGHFAMTQLAMELQFMVF